MLRIYENKTLYSYRINKVKKPNVHTSRKDGFKVNAIISTDTHEIEKGKRPGYVFNNQMRYYRYVVAFVDNVSRYIIHAGLCKDHTAESTAIHLM